MKRRRGFKIIAGPYDGPVRMTRHGDAIYWVGPSGIFKHKDGVTTQIEIESIVPTSDHKAIVEGPVENVDNKTVSHRPA